MFKRNVESLSQEQLEKARAKRRTIIDDGYAMKRLLEVPEFQRFCEILRREKESLIGMLTDKYRISSMSEPERIVLTTRINQIESDINKPNSLIWQMKNLTEVREAIREQTHERQALGNKTGGV